MDDPFIYGLLIISFLVFSLLKSAFSSINLLQLELDKKQRSYYSKILYWISKRTELFEICINLYYYLNISVLLLISINLIDNDKLSLYIPILIIVTSIGIPFIVITPKSLGTIFSNKIINISAIILIILFIIISPITYFSCFIIKIFARNESIPKRKKPKESFSKDDLSDLVNNFSDNNSELKLFQNTLEFSETRIRECMIPRTEIISFEITEQIKELKQKFIDSGFTKIIIYRDSIDNVIGYIKSKSIFFSNSELHQKIKTLPIFPESMSASKLLRFFISTGQNIALVVDEFGGTSGIITTEDILEEIFGEITDEHDTEKLYERKLTSKDYILSARIKIDYLNNKYQLNIPENEEYETLAGYIIYHTENIPHINNIIKIENFLIKILKVTKTRLELIKLEIQTGN
ncbi:MAG: hemolysin family protein [Bacteroidales bacterium]|nr:hemolysin family protein [Bacteroidales bacterium]